MAAEKGYGVPGDESSSSSQTTRLTPDSDSDDSDLELDENELGRGIELQRRDSKTSDASRLDEAADDGAPRFGRRDSMSTVLSYQLYTPDEERAIVAKFDRKLVFFVAVLYMLSFLDRSSV